MDIISFIFILFFLQFVYWKIGRNASKKIDGVKDYFLAGKNVALFPLAMTFLATQVGGGLVLGAAEEAYQFGWAVILYPLGAALGLILLGSGVGSKLSQFQVSTVAQIFEVIYRSPLLKKLASLLSILSLFLILVAQMMASRKFLISLGLDNSFLYVALWAVVILYTVQGGLKAVISTDIIQAGFFCLAFVFGFSFVLYTHDLPSLPTPQWENFSSVSSKLCGWLFMPLLFMVIEQDMGQRCFAGRSPAIVSKASLFAGVAALMICAIPIFFGILAKHLNLDISEGSSVLMSVIEATTTPWLAAIIGYAILAAILSTATSLINAISSNLSNDFAIALFQGNNSVRIIRRMTACIALAAIFSAFYFNNVVDLLILSYELSVYCLFVPIFIALFKKEGNFLSALLAIVFGALSFALFQWKQLSFPKEIIGIALSLLGYMIGEIIEAYRKKNTQDVPTERVEIT